MGVSNALFAFCFPEPGGRGFMDNGHTPDVSMVTWRFGKSGWKGGDKQEANKEY